MQFYLTGCNIQKFIAVIDVVLSIDAAHSVSLDGWVWL